MWPLIQHLELGGTGRSRNRCSLYNTSIVGRLRVTRNLVGHNGCVNALEWNSQGTNLLSTSDDCRVLRWAYPSWKVVSEHQTGHTGNVFCVKYIPHHEQYVATSAADGSVRLLHLERPASMQIIGHKGIVHKFITIPTAPTVLYSCGSDGTVKMYDIRTRSREACTVVDNSSLKSKRALMSIALEPLHHLHFAIGGTEGVVKVYDRRMVTQHSYTCEHRPQSCGLIRQLCPPHLRSVRRPITSVAYSKDGCRLLCSYSSEHIYMFHADMHAHSAMPIPSSYLATGRGADTASGSSTATACVLPSHATAAVGGACSVSSTDVETTSSSAGLPDSDTAGAIGGGTIDVVGGSSTAVASGTAAQCGGGGVSSSNTPTFPCSSTGRMPDLPYGREAMTASHVSNFGSQVDAPLASPSAAPSSTVTTLNATPFLSWRPPSSRPLATPQLANTSSICTGLPNLSGGSGSDFLTDTATQDLPHDPMDTTQEEITMSNHNHSLESAGMNLHYPITTTSTASADAGSTFSTATHTLPLTSAQIISPADVPLAAASSSPAAVLASTQQDAAFGTAVAAQAGVQPAVVLNTSAAMLSGVPSIATSAAAVLPSTGMATTHCLSLPTPHTPAPHAPLDVDIPTVTDANMTDVCSGSGQASSRSGAAERERAVSVCEECQKAVGAPASVIAPCAPSTSAELVMPMSPLPPPTPQNEQDAIKGAGKTRVRGSISDLPRVGSAAGVVSDPPGAHASHGSGGSDIGGTSSAPQSTRGEPAGQLGGSFMSRLCRSLPRLGSRKRSVDSTGASDGNTDARVPAPEPHTPAGQRLVLQKRPDAAINSSRGHTRISKPEPETPVPAECSAAMQRRPHPAVTTSGEVGTFDAVGLSTDAHATRPLAVGMSTDEQPAGTHPTRSTPGAARVLYAADPPGLGTSGSTCIPPRTEQQDTHIAECSSTPETQVAAQGCSQSATGHAGPVALPGSSQPTAVDRHGAAAEQRVSGGASSLTAQEMHISPQNPEDFAPCTPIRQVNHSNEDGVGNALAAEGVSEDAARQLPAVGHSSHHSSPRTPDSQMIPPQLQPPPIPPPRMLPIPFTQTSLPTLPTYGHDSQEPSFQLPDPHNRSLDPRPLAFPFLIPTPSVDGAMRSIDDAAGPILQPEAVNTPNNVNPTAGGTALGPGLQFTPSPLPMNTLGLLFREHEVSPDHEVRVTRPVLADLNTDFASGQGQLDFPDLDWDAVQHMGSGTMAAAPRITLSRWQGHWRYLFEMGSNSSRCNRTTCSQQADPAGEAPPVEGGDDGGEPVCFKGHRNVKTIKDVTFFGDESQYVMTGSDDGRLFLWEAATGRLVLMQRADDRVVNCFSQHPSTCCFASGGIDHTVKVWNPEADAVDDLAEAEDVISENEQVLANPTLSMNLPLEVIRAMLGLRYRGALDMAARRR